MSSAYDHGHMPYESGPEWNGPVQYQQPATQCETCNCLRQAIEQHHRDFHGPAQMPIQLHPSVFPSTQPVFFTAPTENSTLHTSVPADGSQQSLVNSTTSLPDFPPPSQTMNIPRRPRSICRPGANIPTLSPSLDDLAHTSHPHGTVMDGSHPFSLSAPPTSLPSNPNTGPNIIHTPDTSPFPSPASAASFALSYQDTVFTPPHPADFLTPHGRSRAQSDLQIGRKKPRAKAPDYAEIRRIKACEECRRLKRKCSPQHPGVRVPWEESEYRTKSDV